MRFDPITPTPSVAAPVKQERKKTHERRFFSSSKGEPSLDGAAAEPAKEEGRERRQDGDMKWRATRGDDAFRWYGEEIRERRSPADDLTIVRKKKNSGARPALPSW